MDGNQPETLKARGEDAVGKVLVSCYIFLPNEREACVLTGASDAETALRLLARSCPRVAVKLGERGLIASWEGRLFDLPSLNTKVRDSTGAGDSFDAALLAAVLEGRPTEEALARAAAAGALVASSADEDRSALKPEAIDEGAATILAQRRTR
jgi:sugar/nucleoside kinase (ribokinase family)